MIDLSPKVLLVDDDPDILDKGVGYLFAKK